MFTNIKKYSVVFFAVVLMSVMAAPQANAQTTAQLQQQINQLLVQIAALQAQLGGVTGSCTVQFTRSLGIGSTGADVRALQQFLNRSADTRLAVSGAGSPGFETQYYGPITANAVSRFQAKYRAEILTPLGLVNPTGYFGPSSIAKANSLCTVVVPPADDDDEDEDQDEQEELEGGEAVLRNFETDDGEDTSLGEGQSNAPVMDVEFDVDGGDIRVNRIDVALDHVTGGDDDPWDVFENISIWVDGDIIAEMDVDDEDLWDENEPNAGDYLVRLTGVDYVVREGETAEFTVALTVASSVDDAGSVDWEMFIPDDGVRVNDSLNLTHYIGDTDETVGFEINEAGSDDDLVIRTSSEDPDAGVLQVNRSSVSDWLTVFAFELDADDSADDIEINSIPLTVELSNSETYNTIVRDARLVVDGEEYDDFTVSNGGTDTATLTFDIDGDLVIDAGEMVDVELQLEFRGLAEADEGTEVQAYITSAQADDIDAEGADDLTASQISGSATGETHTLRTGGTTLGDGQTSATLKTNSDATTDDDEGVYTITFDVTAFEQDVYVNKSTSRGTTTGTAGVNYVVEDGTGDAVSTGTANAVLSSTASSVGSQFRVREGQTRSFTLTVNYDPTASGFYQVQLHSINYNDTASNPDTYQRALPESRYETDPISI